MRERLHRLPRLALRAMLIALATVYFLIDLIFLSILRPLRRRLMALRLMQRLRAWVGTLNRYAALMLLVIPWLILEPIKPIGFLLFAHRHHAAATLLIVGGEIVKLTLFEQLFDMTKPKLMTFSWFVSAYGRWQDALRFLRSLPAWRRILRWYRRVRAWVIRRLWFLRRFRRSISTNHTKAEKP